MRKLIIDGTQADLSDFQLITLSKKIVDWQKLGSKSSNYSNTVTLPFTETNNGIFENASDLASTGDFRNFYDVNYIQDGQQIISYGKGKLIGTDKKGYKFAFYWGNIDLKEILTPHKISDLDLSDLNHTWHIANVKELELFGGALSYLIADVTGSLNSGLTAGTGIRYYVPFVDVDYLLQKIQDTYGVTFNGLTGRQMWIPVLTRDFKPEYNVEVVRATNQLASVQTDYTATPLAFIELFTKYDQINLNEAGAFSTFLNSVEGTSFTNLEASTATFFFTYNPLISIQTSKGIAETGKCMVRVRTIFQRKFGVNWITYSTYTEPFQEYDLNDLQFHDLQVSGRSEKITLAAGQSIRVRHELELIYPAGLPTFYKTVTTIVRMKPGTSFIAKADLMQYGSGWSMAKNLPDLNLWDFVNDVCFLRGLIFQNETNDTFRFKRVEEIITDIAQELDDKFQNYEIEKVHTDLTQRNNLEYSNDDTTGEKTGWHTFNIEDNTLKTEDSFFQSKFGASEMVTFRDGLAAQILLFKDDKEKEFEKLSPRIVTARIVEDVYITDFPGTSTVFAAQKYVAQFSELQMLTVWKEHYALYETILNKYKQIKCLTNITVEDFQGMDLMRPVYIQQIGTYIIDIIDKFQQGKLTEIKLIKI